MTFIFARLPYIFGYILVLLSPRSLSLAMRSIALVLMLALGAARPAGAADSVLYRLFLLDGSSLVSYGEFARLSDLVVFSMPLGDVSSAANLQLVSIPQASVDWARTDEYSEAVRARRYGETRGESDFAMLGGRVTEALNQIALTPDPARRLAMATEARGNLARWPAENFGYRSADVAQLTGMLDEVISELRVAAGQSSFDVSLVATTTPPPPVELLPPPDFREAIEQALTASAVSPEPAERVSLLRAIATALQEPARRGGWAAALHGRAAASLATELRIDASYRDLSKSTMAAAAPRASRGDVDRCAGTGPERAEGRRSARTPAPARDLVASRLPGPAARRSPPPPAGRRCVGLSAFRLSPSTRRVIASAVDELRRSKRSLEQHPGAGGAGADPPAAARAAARDEQARSSRRSRRPWSSSRPTASSLPPSRWRSVPRPPAGTRYHRET